MTERFLLKPNLTQNVFLPPSRRRPRPSPTCWLVRLSDSSRRKISGDVTEVVAWARTQGFRSRRMRNGASVYLYLDANQELEFRVRWF